MEIKRIKINYTREIEIIDLLNYIFGLLRDCMNHHQRLTSDLGE